MPSYKLLLPDGDEPVIVDSADRDRQWAERLLERLEELLAESPRRRRIGVAVHECTHRCTVCGDPVCPSEMREHLGGHHPEGLELSPAEVRNCFTLIE